MRRPPLNYRTGKGRTRVQKTIKWQGHTLKLETKHPGQGHFARWYFRNERVAISIISYLRMPATDLSSFDKWQLYVTFKNRCRFDTVAPNKKQLLQKGTEALNQIFESLRLDFPE